MVLLSLGPEVITALLWHGAPPRFGGPDLTWLLYGPEKIVESLASPGNMRYEEKENDFPINGITG